MLELAYTPRALKDLLAIPANDRNRIRTRLAAYAVEPELPSHDVRPLIGTLGGLRLRVGDWRVLFDVSGGGVTVRRVLHRREAYR